MTTPKLFNKIKDIATNIETTNIIANSALPKSGGEISGHLNVVGELSGNLSGNAATATKLAKAGKITLEGDAVGSVNFDGTDTTLTVVVVDDLHNHTIDNIDNLDVFLASKAPSASPNFTGTPTAPTASAGTNTTQIATTAFVTTAVSPKANDVDVVKLTGNQTIAGTKTFSSTIAGSINGNAATATAANKLSSARAIDGVNFDGSGSILHYGTCSTAAATAAKTVTLAGYTLDTGSRVMVKFTVTNTAANPTLNVNSTGAKSIMYRGAAITAGYLAANRVYEFVYDGTNYEFVGDINTDTNNKVTQEVSTANGEYALLAMVDAAATATKTNGTRFASGVTLNPSTKTITATTFNGNATTATTASACTGNAATATKLAASKNIALTGDVTGSAGFDGSAAASIATTLANSGVTAGSYGPSANATPAHSGTFSVPYITVDAKGRVTGASTKTITLPADNNTDTKVTQTVSTTNNTYPILACATANATATTTTTAIFASAIKINPSAGSLTATAVYNAVWNDYAEFFPRGEETEAGDFVALSLDSDNEVYVRASKDTSKSVGIHSDSFGHLIGGEDAPDGQDFVEYNLPKFIPVGLVGRVRAKIVGDIKKGDFVVISDIPGVGRKFNKELDSYMDIIGMACESSNDVDIKRVKVKLGN